MNDTDAAIMAEIAERDRPWERKDGGSWLWDGTGRIEGKGRALADRRELLRIVREQEQDAERYRDALEICADDEGPPGAALDAIGINRRNIARHALRADPHDRADDEAAARWTAARIDGGVGQ